MGFNLLFQETVLGANVVHQQCSRCYPRPSSFFCPCCSELIKSFWQINTEIQTPYAYMKMELQQEPNSLVLVTEIDPLNMAEILGQVGGFWDLILIFWPIFFIAASEATPHLKPRNFRKSAVRAKEKVTNVGPAILRNLSVASTTRDPPRSSFHDGPEEMLPAWERGKSSCPQVQWNPRIVMIVHANDQFITINPCTFSLVL